VRILEGKGNVVDQNRSVWQNRRLHFEDNSYTNGWAMFSKDKLLTNYPLEILDTLQEPLYLPKRERRKRSYSVNSQDALWKTQR
jgi:hypothetical protein